MAHFFKYVTPHVGHIIIQNRTLRWSTPSTLNDPFDMQFAFQLPIDRAAVRAMALDKMWQHFFGELLDRPVNEMGRLIRQRRDDFIRPMSREEFNRDPEFADAVNASIDVMEKNRARNSAAILGVFENNKVLCFSDIPDSILMWS